ncbi:hypothetical protein GCM10018780_68570 [Streptomyces lanatus]|nr:hypothetical protein GCM10018780_68570 [Streptomyces lanatus]
MLCFLSARVGVGVAFSRVRVGEADVGAGDLVTDGEADGRSGRESRLGERVTRGGPASSEPPRSSSAETIPVTAPTATTTEAATAMTLRLTPLRRSARRTASRWAREPGTVLLPLPHSERVPRSGEAPGPPTLRPP